jgi:single-stranded DNA-specific DHH superfamily exonuclease
MDYEKLSWLYGSEQRFSGFVKTLEDATKVIALSHTDVDGLGSAKVIDATFSVDRVYLLDYDELTPGLVERLAREKPSHIIITDLMISRSFAEGLAKFAQVLIIDHHRCVEDLALPRVFFLNAQGKCATYLAWYLGRQISDLRAWEWLVAVACIADVMTDEVRMFMIAQFEKEGLDFAEGVKQGRFWELVTGINNALIYYVDDRMQVYHALSSSFFLPDALREPARLVEEEIQTCLQRFERENEIIKGRFYWEFSSKYPIKSVITTILSFQYPQTTIIILETRGTIAHISGRCQDRHEDMNLLLKQLVGGFPDADAGGHIPAAGGHFPLDKLSEFKKRLTLLSFFIFPGFFSFFCM